MADKETPAAPSAKRLQGKLLQRHPAFEDKVPGEIVEFDAKLVKSFDGVVDTHEDAVANPTITRDEAGNVNDLEFNKQVAAEKARADKNKKK